MILPEYHVPAMVDEVYRLSPGRLSPIHGHIADAPVGDVGFGIANFTSPKSITGLPLVAALRPAGRFRWPHPVRGWCRVRLLLLAHTVSSSAASIDRIPNSPPANGHHRLATTTSGSAISCSSPGRVVSDQGRRDFAARLGIQRHQHGLRRPRRQPCPRTAPRLRLGVVRHVAHHSDEEYDTALVVAESSHRSPAPSSVGVRRQTSRRYSPSGPRLVAHARLARCGENRDRAQHFVHIAGIDLVCELNHHQSPVLRIIINDARPLQFNQLLRG